MAISSMEDEREERSLLQRNKKKYLFLLLVSFLLFLAYFQNTQSVSKRTFSDQRRSRAYANVAVKWKRIIAK